MATFGRRDIWGKFVYVYFLIPQGRCLKEDKKRKSCFVQPLWFLFEHGFSSCSSPPVHLWTGSSLDVPYCLPWQNYWHSKYCAVPSGYQTLTHHCPLSAYLTSCGGWKENCGSWKENKQTNKDKIEKRYCSSEKIKTGEKIVNGFLVFEFNAFWRS